MSVSIRVPEWVAKAIREHVAEDGWVGMDGQDAVAHLRKLLEPKPAPRRRASLNQAHPKPDRRDRKAEKRKAQKAEAELMRQVRDALYMRTLKRHGGRPSCERCSGMLTDPHHIFGRSERTRWPWSERTCIGLCRRCHDEVTNFPDLAAQEKWWAWISEFLAFLRYAPEAAEARRRLAGVQDKIATARPSPWAKHLAERAAVPKLCDCGRPENHEAEPDCYPADCMPGPISRDASAAQGEHHG